MVRLSVLRESGLTRAVAVLAWLLVLAVLLAPVLGRSFVDPSETRVFVAASQLAETARSDGPVAPAAEPESGEGLFDPTLRSLAWGLRALGGELWAARAVQALWGALALGAVWSLARRLAGARAGSLAVLALATMPAFFTRVDVLGAGLPRLSLCAVALAGLGVAATRGGGERGANSAALRFGAGLFGIAALGLLVVELARAGQAAPGTVGVGERGEGTSTLGDAARLLGTGLLPWSALLPVALGRLLGAGLSPEAAEERRPTARALPRVLEPRAALLLGAALLAVAVAAALAPGAIGDATWLAAPALAVVLAVWLDGLDRRPESWLAALTVLVVGALLALDCVHFPVKWLEPALGADAAFPTALSRAGRLAVGALVLAPVALSAVLLAAPSSLGVGRGRAVAAVASLGGAGLALLFYPALLEARSPGSAFGAFERLGGKQAELGVLGVSPDAARLALGREAVPLSGAVEAADWLRGGPRLRFVVLARKELPALNAASRGFGLGNLPVVHAGAGEVLLASGELGGERQENPLAALLPAEPPALARPASAELGGVVELLGWELLDVESRERLVALESGAPATLRTCWRVRAPLASLGPGDWTFLVHVDGPGIRANADHAPLGGEYATSLWSPGDVLCDEAELTLDPSFVPGDYELFLGLFRGLRRLAPSAGPSDDDRVAAGRVSVR